MVATFTPPCVHYNANFHKPINLMKYQFNDGGRKAAGWKGSADDCVVRAVAIATERPYDEVYNELFDFQKQWINKTNARKRKYTRSASPRNGVLKQVTREYMRELGWSWVPTMFIGQGCTTHLDARDLPGGRLIVSVSKHVCAVIDGVVHDTHDPTREGQRCVYGYWEPAREKQRASDIEVDSEYYTHLTQINLSNGAKIVQGEATIKLRQGDTIFAIQRRNTVLKYVCAEGSVWPLSEHPILANTLAELGVLYEVQP